jgi:hypothetical protein
MCFSISHREGPRKQRMTGIKWTYELLVCAVDVNLTSENINIIRNTNSINY